MGFDVVWLNSNRGLQLRHRLLGGSLAQQHISQIVSGFSVVAVEGNRSCQTLLSTRKVTPFQVDGTQDQQDLNLFRLAVVLTPSRTAKTSWLLVVGTTAKLALALKTS